MKRQIRQGVFETNSSSVHTLTMCMKSEYDRWISGELVYDDYNEALVEITPDISAKMKGYQYRYFTYDEYRNDDDFDHYRESFTTPNGETIVVFGKYGYDG